jgi:threonine dehydrogenase-like Zn-dependent dehydrogenase
MAAMAEAGTLNLSALEHQRFPLDKINEAIAATDQHNGGLTNIVVMP